VVKSFNKYNWPSYLHNRPMKLPHFPGPEHYTRVIADVLMQLHTYVTLLMPLSDPYMVCFDLA